MVEIILTESMDVVVSIDIFSSPMWRIDCQIVNIWRQEFSQVKDGFMDKGSKNVGIKDPSMDILIDKFNIKTDSISIDGCKELSTDKLNN